MDPESEPADTLDRGEVVLAVIEGRACINKDVNVAAAFKSRSVSCEMLLILPPMRSFCFPLWLRPLSLRLSVESVSSRRLFA